jgi:hypothetical protein
MLEHALEYIACGFRIFPCKPGTKVPATLHGSKDATDDVTLATKWWTACPHFNIAIATGDSIYVVDVDDPESTFIESLPATLKSKTPRGGSHFVYSTSVRLPNSTSKLAKKVDTRGQGGYIVVAPSVVDVRSGRPESEWGAYEWVSDTPIAPLPQTIIDALTNKTIVPSPYIPTPRVDGYGTKALDDECRKVANAIEGTRNHTLNTCAFKIAQLVAGGQLDEALARDELEQAALHAGLTEAETQKTISSAFKSGMDHPRVPSLREVPPMPDIEFYCDDSVLIEDVKVSEKKEDTHDDDQKALLAKVQALGGLCNWYTAWVLNNADYQQPNLAIGSLVALGSVLAARRMVFSGLTSSEFVCIIAKTGDGKGSPQSCLTRLLETHWSTVVGASDFSSTVSTKARISQAANAGVGIIFPVDEYGAKLKGMFGNSHLKEVRTLLLEIATIGTGDYKISASLARGGVDEIIRAPGVTMYASTTPETLHDALKEMSLKDGFLGRHLWFDTLNTLPFHSGIDRDEVKNNEIPIDIVNAVIAIRERHEAWHKSMPPTGTSTGKDMRPLLMYDPMRCIDGGAKAVLGILTHDNDDRRRNPREDDVVQPQILARSTEHAARLSMILAVLSQPHDSTVVTDAIARVAIDIVDMSNKCISKSIEEFSAETETERNIKRVLSALRKMNGPNGWVPKRELLRKVRAVKSQEIDEILNRLAQDGTIQAKETRTSSGHKHIVVKIA